MSLLGKSIYNLVSYILIIVAILLEKFMFGDKLHNEILVIQLILLVLTFFLIELKKAKVITFLFLLVLLGILGYALFILFIFSLGGYFPVFYSVFTLIILNFLANSLINIYLLLKTSSLC